MRDAPGLPMAGTRMLQRAPFVHDLEVFPHHAGDPFRVELGIRFGIKLRGQHGVADVAPVAEHPLGHGAAALTPRREFPRR